LIQFLSNLTASGGSKQEEEEVNASAAYMAGITRVLNSIHCLCALGNDAWILDSGASEHMCSDQAVLHDLASLRQPILVNLPNGSQVKVTKHGKLRISKDLVLNHVLHVPNFKFNLLSIKRLCDQLKCSVGFTENACFIQGHSLRRPLAIGKSLLGLYILDKDNVWDMDTQAKGSDVAVTFVSNSLWGNKSGCNAVITAARFDVWHNRLGHMSVSKMNVVPQLANFHNNSKHFVCEICLKAKQHRLPFPTSQISTSSTFELLHIDTWGPYHTKTPLGHRYFLTIVDDYSRGTWTHLMVTKDEAITLIKRFVIMAKTQLRKL